MLAAEEKPNMTKPALGIIPIGTGNDFIKSTSIPKNIKAACEHIAEHSSSAQLIDVGVIEAVDRKSDTNQHIKRYFVNNIGSGFDGKIGLTASQIPFIKGRIVYILALVWHLIKGIPKPDVSVKLNGVELQEPMTLAAIANGKTYGGSFNIAPDAKLNDGLFDCAFLPATGRIGVIPLLIQLLQGKHLKNPKVTYQLSNSFSLKSKNPIVVIADGE